MNDQKARFILSAYRPDHEDRGDAEFREALELVEKDAALRAWFEDQVGFDRSIVAALQEAPVPESLHADILAGGGVSARKPFVLRNWFAAPAVRALAAAIVIGLFVAVTLTWRTGGAADWKAATLATLTEMSEKKVTLDLKSSDPGVIESWLDKMNPKLGESYPVAMSEVGPYGCKEVRSADGRVTIVCFEKDGTMFHLASYQVPEGEPVEGTAESPVVDESGQWLLASWRRGEFAHMLITSDKRIGNEALIGMVRGFDV